MNVTAYYCIRVNATTVLRNATTSPVFPATTVQKYTNSCMWPLTWLKVPQKTAPRVFLTYFPDKTRFARFARPPVGACCPPVYGCCPPVGACCHYCIEAVISCLRTQTHATSKSHLLRLVNICKSHHYNRSVGQSRTAEWSAEPNPSAAFPVTYLGQTFASAVRFMLLATYIDKYSTANNRNCSTTQFAKQLAF